MHFRSEECIFRGRKSEVVDFRSDREVVLMAVQSDGLALRFASEELRADREVVLRSVMKK